MSKTVKLICLAIVALITAVIFATVTTQDTPYIGPAPPRGDFSLCEGFTVPYTPGIKKTGFPINVRLTEIAPCSNTAENKTSEIIAGGADSLIGAIVAIVTCLGLYKVLEPTRGKK